MNSVGAYAALTGKRKLGERDLSFGVNGKIHLRVLPEKPLGVVVGLEYGLTVQVEGGGGRTLGPVKHARR